MIKELAMKWPVMRQIFEGGDGTGRGGDERRDEESASEE